MGCVGREKGVAWCDGRSRKARDVLRSVVVRREGRGVGCYNAVWCRVEQSNEVWRSILLYKAEKGVVWTGKEGLVSPDEH